MATVLIVDDHPELREIVVEFLRHKRYQVHEARSGKSAIEILNNTPVDAVIADLRLPGTLTGIDVLSHHKKLVPKGCRILLTAASSDRVRRVCQYNNVAFLQKPIGLHQLIRTLESSLAPDNS
jgi:two-component system response regulator YesN